MSVSWMRGKQYELNVMLFEIAAWHSNKDGIMSVKVINIYKLMNAIMVFVVMGRTLKMSAMPTK